MCSIYRRQRLVPYALHHGFKIFPDLVRETKSFDDGSRSKQWQDANIVEGQLTVDRQGALDQTTEFLKFGCQCVDLLAGLGPELHEVSKLLALAHDIVVERGDRAKLRQAKQCIAWPSQRYRLDDNCIRARSNLAALRAGQNRIAKAVDVADHIHAFQHGLPVVLHQNRNNTFADEASHCVGIVFENDCLL